MFLEYYLCLVGEAPEEAPEMDRLQEDFKYNGNPYIDLRGHRRAKRQSGVDGNSEDGSEDVSGNYLKDDSDSIQANMSFHHLEVS